MEHTAECTKKHSEAEIASKISLFNPDCPRCRLNYAAPDLLKASKAIAEAEKK